MEIALQLIVALLGGGIVSAAVTWWTHKSAGRRAQADWARDLRLKTYSELVASMDDHHTHLLEIRMMIIDERWYAFGTTPGVRLPPTASGLFGIMASADVKKAQFTWLAQAYQFGVALNETGTVRKAVARDRLDDIIEPDGFESIKDWGDIELLSRMSSLDLARGRVLEAIRASLGVGDFLKAERDLERPAAQGLGGRQGDH
ncbi:hypothetical protein [Sinomonas sp. ASV322]|uniref:hypothetical protein n=1 Tax=Sinomonas sp. ASV322 TaxID=3041920 RepID=UPI0027DAF5E3|nr:hypothetical protein [Sinomonas sp. ASV322]MDQ4502202.1 hypothetical protein [Sinomonas sp. ASV322]